MKSIRYHQHTVVPSLIARNGTVLDCGANHGDFSKWISELTGAEVHAFEADPDLFSALPSRPRVTNQPFAIASKPGTLRFNLGTDQTSSLQY